MSGSDKDPKPVASLREEVVNVVAKSRGAIYGSSSVEPFIAQALEAIPAAVERSDDYAPATAAIQQSLLATERLQTILRDTLKQIEALEAIRARRERYSERWWQQQRQELSQVFQNDPRAGVDRWLQTYADALLTWELVICEKLVQEAFPFPSSAAHLPALFQQGTLAIREERYLEALSMLTYLAQAQSASQSSPLLDPTSQALLNVFMGRISLYYSTNREQALTYFQQARELAPDDGRPFAALGDYYRAENESRQAPRFYQQAIERSPGQPDGYSGMGALAEDQKRWDEVEEWYERAIETVRDERDVEVGLRKLLAPVSGNLYLSLAHFFAKEEAERALRLVTRALDLGIKADGDYPERLGYELKGDLLAALQKPTEAAEAYYKAGQKFGWETKHQKAAELLEKAQTLNPGDVRIYWSYSEALRMQSYLPDLPYVDKALIEKSLAVWEQGVKLELPDASYSWAYVGRALINDQLARLRDDQRIALQWEAIVYLHRAILLRMEDAHRWAYLGRFLNTFEQEATALCVTRKALEYGPETFAALEERASILANIGDFPEATKLIDRRLKLEPNAWARGVKAFVRFFQGQYEEALDLIEQSVKAEDIIWNRNLRANCRLMLDRPSLAWEDYAWIRERHNNPNFSHIDNQSDFAWAAYHLAVLSNQPALLNEAIDEFIELRKDPTQRVNSNLGICLLTRGEPGDVEEGKNCLEEGIRQASNARELEGNLKHDLPLLEQRLSQWPHGEQVRAVLERVKPQIEARHKKLKRARPRSAKAEMKQAERELKKVIENPESKDATNGWAMLGARAQLAQIYREQQRWGEAAKTYQQILSLPQPEPGRFPEARLGLGTALDKLQEAGDHRLKEGKPAEALEQFSQAHRFTLESLTDEKEREANLLCRIGYAYFDLEELDKSRTNFIKALQLYHENNNPDPGEELGFICSTLLRDATRYWALDDEWKAWAEEAPTEERLHSELAAARKELAAYLDKLCQLSSQAGTGSQMLPVITPIAVEIGQTLIPEDTSMDSPLFKTLLPAMRDRLQNEMGVRVPGVRIRGNETDLPPESYIILLDEIPLVLGNLATNKRYCPAPSAKLQALGIPVADLTETPHPLTGEPGCWVQPEHSTLILGHGLELWSEPLLFMIYHLEAVLRHNLADFLGVQEVENLLETWGQTESGSALIQAALPDPDARLRLARLLGALVKEQVPITPWEEILATVQSVGLTRDEVSEAVCAVRLRLKHLLPGNSPTAERLELPANIEEAINHWIWRADGKTFFAIPTEETHELLAEIRALVGSPSRNLVLVTRSAELRPFVRRLVEREFPDLLVIAQEELLARETVQFTEGVITDA